VDLLFGLTHVLAALDGSGFGRENNTAGLFERQEKSKKTNARINYKLQPAKPYILYIPAPSL